MLTARFLVGVIRLTSQDRMHLPPIGPLPFNSLLRRRPCIRGPTERERLCLVAYPDLASAPRGPPPRSPSVPAPSYPAHGTRHPPLQLLTHLRLAVVLHKFCARLPFTRLALTCLVRLVNQ